MESFNLQISKRRVQLQLSQRALADKMDCGQSDIARIENPKTRSVTIATLERFAKALGCRLEVTFVPNET